MFARARENARRASCQSNLKQIGLGFRQYTQDYDEKYPLISASTAAPTAAGWANQMQPYLKSTQIFQCPSETVGPNTDPTTTGYTDYWYNSALAGASEAQVGQVATTVLNGDGASNNSTYAFNGVAITADGTAPANGTTRAAAVIPASSGNFGLRHLDGLNYAFADGHVKWYKSQDNVNLNKVWNVNVSYGGTTLPIANQDPTFYAGS